MGVYCRLRVWSWNIFGSSKLTKFIDHRLRRRQDALMQSVFSGPVYVVRDNIDTDQMISAQYLNLVPTIPEEYEKLGSFALAGLPDSLYPIRFVKPGQMDSDYPSSWPDATSVAAAPASTRPSRSARPDATLFWRRVSPAFSSAIPWPPANFIRAN